MSKRAGKFAIGAAVAAAAGYVTGILTAPKSGKETREDIKEGAIKARTEAEKKLKAAHTELQQLTEKGQASLKQATDKTKRGYEQALSRAEVVKEKAKGLLTALHEGDSSDKDLQQALTEAEEAINHLRQYVNKDTKGGKAAKK